MKRVFLLVALFVLSISYCDLVAAADSAPPKLYFQNRQFDPLKESLDNSAQSAKVAPARRAPAPEMNLLNLDKKQVEKEYQYYIVQFTGPIDKIWKDELGKLGAVFFDYIPQYAFIVKFYSDDLATVRAKDYVRFVGEYSPDLKFAQNVYDLTPEEYKEQKNKYELVVTVFPGEDFYTAKQAVEDAGGTILSSSENEWQILFEISIDQRKIEGLKDIKGVKWIERKIENKFLNNIGTGIMQLRSEQEKTWPASHSQFWGEGQIVAICDSGLDSGDPDNIHKDFTDGEGNSRVIEIIKLSDGVSQKDYDGHGTHVAGSVAGNGMLSGADPAKNLFPDTCYAGVAPKAKIYFQSVASGVKPYPMVGIPADLNALFSPAYVAGARIHQNSWGANYGSDYDAASRQVDQFMWGHKDFLTMFSAGNAGVDKDVNGVIDKYSLDSPGTAKNCLTVGASESFRTGAKEGRSNSWGSGYGEPIESDFRSNKPSGMAAFSSRGPTLDGRYKPEVVAPGTNILSTRSSYATEDGWGPFNDDYYWMGGTSMATPLVSGTAVIFREYLQKEEGFAYPSAALLKTGLIHGTVSMVPGQYGTGATQEIKSAPSDVQGWGRVNFAASINSDKSYKISYNDIATNAPTDSSYKKTLPLK
ncbi:S8 family serine peptidase [Desulfovibrio sp. JC010]|uniref:S8 family serine peptidase n=1 Tax=Desulfovibrio sp. JC010 TaxID=2593641 RepID=UPI0013D5EBE4|nr:S8 family serine peptidase [Desulfovibrio sp. JC010]NDV26454.1 S8 family serine peptidase [Desulfovibrio sp. JC010]